MTTPTDIKYIVRSPDVYGGKPCIEGHRIAVHDIAVAHNQGYSPERMLVECFPTLTLAQVYAALLYCADHKDEIDREIAEDDVFIREQAARQSDDRLRRAIAKRKRQMASDA